MTPGADRGLRISLSAIADVEAVGERWLALQSRSDCSFFQSWAWVGCLAQERFDDAVLLEAWCGGQPVAMALFNRCAGGWLAPAILRLGESGQPALDAVFVEHNGPLLARGKEHLLGPCLRAAFRAPLKPGRRRLMLSGVGDACLRAVPDTGGVIRVARTAPAPVVDFSRLGEKTGFLDSLSANTRYQIRRSHQRYGASGALAVRRAGSVSEAQGFLDDLAILHQRRWTARGKPGAFADPAFRRFHQALIARAQPDGAADLLRITAGDRVIGYLYNFCFGGRVSAYQSGFDYEVTSPHQKPGLTCHALAIEMYRAEGARYYDFLAGGDRYKSSLANASASLHWIEIVPRFSLRGLLFRLADLT